MILLTHNVDLDGLGSVILSRYNGIKYNQVVMCSYDSDDIADITPYASKDQMLIVTDYRVSKTLYDFYNSNFEDFLVFDHHEESLEFKDDERVFVDTEKCGTRLFYENFIIDESKNEASDYLVKLIDTYDIWRKESELWEEAQNLNRVLWSTMNYSIPDKNIGKFNLFINLQLDKLQKNCFKWTNFELDKISYVKTKEDEAVDKALSILQIREDTKGKKFGLIFGKNKISWVCNAILEKHTYLSYIISINTYQKNYNDEGVNGKVSVRSTKPFSVRDLTGIEGHEGAGGGAYDISFLIDLWEGRVLQIPYQRQIVEEK